MAVVRMHMQALGQKHEQCAGCDRHFERGEVMAGIEYDDGEPAGWYCEACLARWKEGE